MIANTKQLIRLGLLDDHQIVIDGLKLLLNDQANLQVVVESIKGNDFIKQLKSNPLDIVLTDIIMPNQMNGVEIAKFIKTHFPSLAIIVLSMNEDKKVIYELINEIGVEGFISKATGKEELLLAIKTVYQGKQYFAPEIKNLLSLQQRILKETNELHLSKREMDIIQGIEKRLTNKQIADQLFISDQTVETHRKNIYRKTNTKGEAALIEFLKRKGVIN